jgi:hypothetical protein
MAKDYDYPSYDAGGRVGKYKEGGKVKKAKTIKVRKQPKVQKGLKYSKSTDPMGLIKGSKGSEEMREFFGTMDVYEKGKTSAGYKERKHKKKKKKKKNK